MTTKDSPHTSAAPATQTAASPRLQVRAPAAWRREGYRSSTCHPVRTPPTPLCTLQRSRCRRPSSGDERQPRQRVLAVQQVQQAVIGLSGAERARGVGHAALQRGGPASGQPAVRVRCCRRVQKSLTMHKNAWGPSQVMHA